MTAALEVGEWSAARPGPTLDSVHILQEAGWAPGPVWTAEILVPTGIRSRTVQPLVSRYTDWATWPTIKVAIVVLIVVVVVVVVVVVINEQQSDPDSNIIYGSNSEVTITKSDKT